MKIFRLSWLLALCCMVANLSAEQKWLKVTAPYIAFEQFSQAAQKATDLQDLRPLLLEDSIKTSMDELGEIRVEFNVTFDLPELRETLKHMEVLYFKTNRKGIQTFLTLEGIDTKAQQPAVWTVYMIEEKGGWKFRRMDVKLDTNAIKGEMRRWTLGKDKIALEALYKSIKGKQVILLTDDMQEVSIPMSELSDEDVYYLGEFNTQHAVKLNAYRAKLKDKAQVAGLIWKR